MTRKSHEETSQLISSDPIYIPRSPQERLGIQYRSYYWKRFLMGALLFSGFAYVSTLPYLKLSETPMKLLNHDLHPVIEALLYFAVYDSTFINGLMLYPRQTTMLCFTLASLFSDLCRGNLKLPFFQCGSQPKLAAKYFLFVLGTALAGFSAFLAAQIFRNALEKEGVDEWVKWGMVACRFAIVFNSLMNWINKWIGSHSLADTNELRNHISLMHKHVNKKIDRFAAGITDRDIPEKNAFETFLATLLASENDEAYLSALVTYCSTDSRFHVPESTQWTFTKKCLVMLEFLIIVGISILATTAQYLGVMAYYTEVLFGILALVAICFGLYCDNVKQALESIFDKEQYKKQFGLIARQTIAGIGGACSGLSSVAIIIAASQVEGRGQPLLESPLAFRVEIAMTYLNGALLNGLACFRSLVDVMWWFRMLKGSLPCRSVEQQERSNLEAYCLGVKEYLNRFVGAVSHFDLSAQALAALREHVEERIQWDSRPRGIAPALVFQTNLPKGMRDLQARAGAVLDFSEV